MYISNKALGLTAPAVVLVIGAAAVASYVTKQEVQAPVQANAHPPVHGQRVADMQPPKPHCDDKNIVGTVAGGVAGGVLGNQIGHGTGKTVATIGGVGAGALLGNEYIPTRNVTCRD